MPFTAIKGTFHIVGYSPDGDSIRFKAFDPANWSALDGKKVALNAKGHAQLRIEAIDTLETHYKNQHQPLQWADAAALRLFSLLGIKNVVWNASHSKVTSAEDGVEGFIVSRTTEENGRPVSYVFPALSGLQDGQPIFLEKALVRKSINFRLLREGLAYPTFYDGLFYDLRELFASETKKARAKKIGVWSGDMSHKFMRINSLADITERLVLLPKLFRRMVAYFQQDPVFDPIRFLQFVDALDERVLILSKLHFTHLEDILEVNAGGEIRLVEEPEGLVFLA